MDIGRDFGGGRDKTRDFSIKDELAKLGDVPLRDLPYAVEVSEPDVRADTAREFKNYYSVGAVPLSGAAPACYDPVADLTAVGKARFSILATRDEVLSGSTRRIRKFCEEWNVLNTPISVILAEQPGYDRIIFHGGLDGLQVAMIVDKEAL